MTSLDPSHLSLPFSSSRTGHAVVSSTSPLSGDGAQASTSAAGAEAGDKDTQADPYSLEWRREAEQKHGKEHDEADDEADQIPFWRGAWERRQEERRRMRRAQREQGRLPMPVPVPDLRFEQGYLASIRPFLHTSSAPTATSDSSTARTSAKAEKHEIEKRAASKGAAVSSSLTAEGGAATAEDPDAQHADVFFASGPLKIQWDQVAYITARDQLVFPLLQGFFLCWGTLLFSSWWAYERVAKEQAPRARRSGTLTGALFGAIKGLFSGQQQQRRD